MIKRNTSELLKIVLISFLVSFNVCLWRDVFEDIFDEAVFAIVLFIIGLTMLGRIFYSKRG